jgi:copper homeostasis protein
LTSGQEESVTEGAELIAELVRRAGGRIVVMPGGGFTERNIARLVARTGASEVHLTGFRQVASRMNYRNERVFMGGTLRPPEYARAVTDAGVIKILKEASKG